MWRLKRVALVRSGSICEIYLSAVVLAIVEERMGSYRTVFHCQIAVGRNFMIFFLYPYVEVVGLAT